MSHAGDHLAHRRQLLRSREVSAHPDIVRHVRQRAHYAQQLPVIVLKTGAPSGSSRLNALGTEAGESRLWAGIHFPSDIAAGLALGRSVAQLVVERAKQDGSE